MVYVAPFPHLAYPVVGDEDVDTVSIITVIENAPINEAYSHCKWTCLYTIHTVKIKRIIIYPDIRLLLWL